MEYIDHRDLSEFLYNPDFVGECDGFSAFPAAKKIQMSPIFIITSIVTIIISILLYFSLGKVAAIIPIGILVLILIFISPRIGIVLVLALQVWDVVLNPERGGGYEWVSPGRILTILCVLCYWLRFFGKSHSLGQSKSVILFLSGFVLWALFSILWSSYKIIAMWSFVKIFVQFSLIYIAVDLLTGRKVLEQILFFIAVGGCTAALYALFGGIAVTTYSHQRLVLKGAGTNAVGISLGISMVATIAIMLLRGRSVFILATALVSFVSLGAASIKTGTRSVIVGVPLAVSFGLLIGYWRKVGKLFLLGILIFLLLGGIMYWALNSGFISGALSDRILGVFKGETYEANVRWELWRDSLNLYLKKPMGVGIGNEVMAFLESDIGYEKESHNTLISVLIECNLIGLVLFTCALVAIMIKIICSKDRGLRCIAGMFFIFCMINAMKGTIHTVRLFWLPITLTMIVVETDFRSRFEKYFEADSAYANDQEDTSVG